MNSADLNSVIKSQILPLDFNNKFNKCLLVTYLAPWIQRQTTISVIKSFYLEG